MPNATDHTLPTPELLDVVNYNGIPVGRTHVRGEKIDSANGDYFCAVVVCIMNSQGQMLIQQRQKDKRSWPNLWDVSCGGAVIAGEEPQISGMREVAEELGLTISLEKKRPNVITTFRDGFTYTFILNMDVNLEDVVLQPEEVQAVKLATKAEILQMIEDETFIPYRKSWLDLIFDTAENEYIF